MSVSQLPNKRWRAQVYDPKKGRQVSAAVVLGLPRDQSTFKTKTEARNARDKARLLLLEQRPVTMTVRAWADIWTTDPLYQRPKESTNITNRGCVKGFVDKHGHLRLDRVTDQVIARWLAGGKMNYTVPALRAMFNDAASAKAGRLIAANPFANLGISRGRGNADKQPPSVDEVWAMIAAGERVGSPMFSAWLQVACFTGMRPGELDALRWECIDGDKIHVVRQFSAATRSETPPKNGRARTILLTPQARTALDRVAAESPYCFVNLRGNHFTPSSRAYPWKATRAACGLDDKTLYLCTRHFAGWYMVNVLEMNSEDVAIQLGHEDGGELVRRLYGHRDRSLALDRLREAFETTHATTQTVASDADIALGAAA
jgi:integrase